MVECGSDYTAVVAEVYPDAHRVTQLLASAGQAVSVAINTPPSLQMRILQGRAVRCPHGKVLSVSVGSLIVNWISSYGGITSQILS